MSYVICHNCDMICKDYVDEEQESIINTYAYCDSCQLYYHIDTNQLANVDGSKLIIKKSTNNSTKIGKNTFQRNPVISNHKENQSFDNDFHDIYHQQHFVENDEFVIGLNKNKKRTNKSLLASSLDSSVTSFHIGNLNIPTHGISKKELINQSLSQIAKLAKPRTVELTERNHQLKLMAQKFFFMADYEYLLSLPSLHFTPYEFQILGPQKILGEMNGRAILADEVGLGKTLQSGIIIKELILRELITSCMILVPTSLKNQWEEELFEKFDLKFHVAESGKELKELLVRKKFIIASVYLFSRNKDDLSEIETDLLIVDEAHRLRNKSTNLHKSIVRVKSKFRLLVTATPFQNNLSELYNLVNVLRPGALGKWSDFKSRFINIGDSISQSEVNLLRGIVRKYVIRRRRKSLNLKIPNRSARTIRLNLNNAEKTVSDIAEEYITELTKSDSTYLSGIKGLLMCSFLRRATSSGSAIRVSFENAKKQLSDKSFSKKSINNLSTILEHGIDTARKIQERANSTKLKAVIKELNKTDGQLIIFSEFKATTSWLSEELQLNGFNVSHFHGSVSSYNRFNLVKDFWEKKSQVFVSTDAGSEGLNLQVANKLMNFDLPWNPMRIEQRIGRIHRLTQQNEVEVINLVLKNTIEQRVLDKVLIKIGLFEDIIGGLDEIVGKITNSNLEKSEDAIEYVILNKYLNSKKDSTLSWSQFDAELEKLGNTSEKVRNEIEDHNEDIDKIIL
ncbi:MAG: DEAD/DEAH box helicase [Candidatus Heimdallarchaeota archaeon]|nr:DEAD/DEAH box helicase [Candidatus Heimdallarchaeota archaeon]